MLWIPHQLVGVPLYFNVTLECFTEAHPTSLNYWTREDGHMIHDSKKYRTESNVGMPVYKTHMRLHIYNIQQTDYGTYKVTARTLLATLKITIIIIIIIIIIVVVVAVVTATFIVVILVVWHPHRQRHPLGHQQPNPTPTSGLTGSSTNPPVVFTTIITVSSTPRIRIPCTWMIKVPQLLPTIFCPL
uniref:Ig-like domain-containing protein n=1 Tax=Anopheles farauti TaxID=69004 RepID=A0A182QZS9_9DIPT